MTHFCCYLREVGPFPAISVLGLIRATPVLYSATGFQNSNWSNASSSQARYYGNNELHFIPRSCNRVNLSSELHIGGTYFSDYSPPLGTTFPVQTSPRPISQRTRKNGARGAFSAHFCPRLLAVVLGRRV